MKKNLLLASLALASAATAMAGVDPATYAETEGVTLKSNWLISRTLDNDEYRAQPWTEDWDRVRTATVVGDKVYLGYSHKVMVGEELNAGRAFLVEYELYTGKYVRTIQVTVEGQPVDGLLCANSVGTDDFGNLWFAGYSSSFYPEGNARPITFYVVDDLNTGAAHVAAQVGLPEDEAEADARTDYYDVVGDITGEKAGSVIMTAGCEGAQACYVYGWSRDQGSDKWEPRMNDYAYVAGTLQATIPADQTSLSYCSLVSIVRDDEHSGSQYYVDGFTTIPSLYDTEGNMIDSFEAAPDLMPVENAANGIVEFKVGDNNYIVYASKEYAKDPGFQFRIARTGEGGAFEGMKLLWDVPEAGLGTTSNTGLRIQNFKIIPVKDENGKEAVRLFTFVANAGLGLYTIAQPGFKDDLGGVNDIVADSADANAPVEYFTVHGIRVAADNLPAGLYITRQGNKTSKVVVK